MENSLKIFESIQSKLSKEELEVIESKVSVNALKGFIGSSSKHLTTAKKREKKALENYLKKDKKESIQLELLKFDD
ncbi:MAG: hypothetical protein ACPGJV_02570 [Bacteriovoracaceae bacterium]